MDDIGIHFNASQRRDRGTWKVAANLLKGLDLIGQKYTINQVREYNGVLQGNGDMWKARRLMPRTLWGPNLVVLPAEAPWCFADGAVHCVPCEWVRSHYMIDGACFARLHVWPVGIDTEEFKPVDCRKTYDALIYFKNATNQRSLGELAACQQLLKRYGQSFQVIHYGQYVEEQYKDLLSRCRYQVIMAGTESQFIALLESFAMGVPAYVFDETTMLYGGMQYRGLGFTTAPYFDERCGIVAEDAGRFEEFLSQIVTYRPRDYVTENLSLEKQAAEYLTILGKT